MVLVTYGTGREAMGVRWLWSRTGGESEETRGGTGRVPKENDDGYRRYWAWTGSGVGRRREGR